MSENIFGGSHSELKLNVVEEYLRTWLQVMKRQSFNRRYIDAFSGSGHFAPKNSGDLSTEDENRVGEEFLKGSAIRAIQMDPPFDRFDFIELDAKKAETLKEKVAVSGREQAFVHSEDVNVAIPRLCAEFRELDRAVLFLDPFGAQVDWATVEAIAATEKIDLWYLLPVSITNRLISKREHIYSDAWAKRLTACLGTKEWRSEFFAPDPQSDLFGHAGELRVAGLEKVEKFFQTRLETVFPKVSKKCVRLVTPQGTHLFSLCFAVSNPEPKAIGAAMRIANHLIEKWERPNG